MMLSYRYRLFTTARQELSLAVMFNAFCDLYNAALQQRIEAYRRKNRTLGYKDQAGELKAVRAADERLASYSFSAEQQILRRLDKTFRAFFDRCKRGMKPGFPRFRSSTRFDAANFRVGDGLTLRKNGRLGIVGVEGEIKVKWHRQLPLHGKLGAATISRRAGKWFVCFQVEIPNAEVSDRQFAPVGIDVGLTSLVALSTSETVSTPQFTKRAAKALRCAQRTVARRRKASIRHRKAKARVTRLAAKIAAQRKDFSHKLSRSLADRFTHIAFEDLHIKGLARGMFAKAVQNAAWRQLVQHVSYKAENAGGNVVLVDPRGTSRTCPECGIVEPKPLAMREHRCQCGCVLDRDVAAARIILQRANFRPGHGLRNETGRVAA